MTATALAQVSDGPSLALPALVDRAAAALASARSAAEILDAKDIAAFAYDMAKRAARLAEAKGAHDALVAQMHRAQADALQIEAHAKRRLADEYDAAQERGEVSARGQRNDFLPEEEKVPTVADIPGLTHKDIHEARLLRDAEKADPGITKRILDERLEKGEEPSKAALRAGIIAASAQALRGGAPSPSRKNPLYRHDPQSEAVTLIVGSCGALLDGAGELTPQYILGGFHDAGDRARGLAKIAACRDFLTRILESTDGA